MRRALRWLLRCLFALLLLLLPACGGEELPQVDSAGETDLPMTESTAPSNLTLIDTAGLSDYVIIRPTEAAQEEIGAAMAFRDAIAERYGVTLEVKIDLIKERTEYMEVEYEILVGDVNREACAAEAEVLQKSGDWVIARHDKKLVICGKTPTATQAAVDAMIGALPNALPLAISDDVTRINRTDSHLKSIKLGETELAAGSIVLPASAAALDMASAVELQSIILKQYGAELPITRGEQGGAGIYLVPNADAVLLGEADAALIADGDRLLAAGCTAWDALRALQKLKETLANAPSGDLSFDDGYRLEVPRSDNLCVMTYNILLSASTLEARQPLVTRVIAEQLPDTLGLQEVTSRWVPYLEEALGEVYGCVYEGREGGTGEDCGEAEAIFYNKIRFNLIDSGTFWLSDTPEVPSKYEDSKQKRLCVWVILEDKTSGKRFVHMSTHLDNKGVDARTRQQEVLRTHLDAFPYPVVLTGDFNYNETSSTYVDMLSTTTTHRKLVNSRVIASKKIVWPTYNGLGSSSMTLDYIFLTKDCFAVSNFSVLQRIYDGIYPSDHNAVCINCTLIDP